MTHEDWMQVLGIVVTVLVGAVSAVIRVLFKHSNRLTDCEANIRAMRAYMITPNSPSFVVFQI